MIELQPNEHIVTAWAEKARGPGWSNAPVWVLVGTATGYRMACLHPHEQSNEMLTLRRLSAIMHQEMTAAAERLARKEPGG